MGAQGGPEYPCLNDDSLLFVWDPKNNKCWENGSTSLIASNPLTGSMVNDTANWNFSAITSSAGGLSFDGTDDYIEYSDQANWQFSSTGISACAWFYWDGTSQSTIISSKRKDASLYNNMSLGMMNSTWYGGSAKKIGGLFLSDGGGAYIQTAPDLVYDITSEDVGWHHVIITVDSTSDSKIYLDGALKLTKALNRGDDGGVKSWGVSGGPFCIGGQWISSAVVPTWKSYLGPVYYYKRQISASEVLKNYNVLKGRFGL
jgi:hypothetical protein